jgi:squalene-hopene cyclase-like protein
LDYILAAGDSWHANTPRRGGILDRVSSVHQETSLCVACHVTHFSQRAQLYATRNGYPVVQRQQLQFLSERFYNNPRPFYGFEQTATWARMISASANVLGRMSHLMDLFEEQITGERRDSFHKGISGYLDLYYKGRDKLPPDETNGNTPLVSAHEVAWYAWTDTKDPRMGDMIAKGEVKNTIDLCYQTLALAEIAPDTYKDLIAKNAQRILSLQRSDGQWSARFEEKQPEVEFQTGHALWALHAAGVPASNPQVARGLRYLLGRQQPFGGWMDPRQSFENFRTPFRETQMAILALSSYYPLRGRSKGWNSPHIDRLSADPAELLGQLDDVWDAPSPEVRKQIEAAAISNDALIRQAAIEALGRLGELSPVYAKALGDPSKLVQRTAAWALRQSYSRHTDTPSQPILSALNSADDRTRWGATRVFAAHFAELARRADVAGSLVKLANDQAISTRMNAIKGMWQLWFWTSDLGIKEQIEDSLIAQLGTPQSPWIKRNLDHAIYNLADENIRYLYNNWVPLLARDEDKERAVKGRLAVEARLANKFAAVLENGSSTQRKELLRALTELPLRRADVYDLKADLSQTAPPIYNRIGNDIEQIAFFGQSRERMARVILPLLDSTDSETRRLASQAVLLVRDTRFADVNRIAGPAGNATERVIAKVESVPEGAEVAHVLKPPARPAAQETTSKIRTVSATKLDEAYFRGYVEPILQKRGKDGYACVHCHATHTLFDGTWSTVKNVVNTAAPEESLLLRKPTSSSETEGIVNSGSISHGGGVRWAKDSPEYLIILDWIKGNKE